MNIRKFYTGRAIGFLVVVVLVAGFFAFNSFIYNEKQGTADIASDFKDATYVIDGAVVTLKNGVAENEITPDSASKVVTRYFGNEVYLDLNNDEREDVVFLVTQETGGSGIFYYVVAALNTEEGYVGSQALFLGDRIAPQTTEISQNPRHVGVVVVNYADRAQGESFAEQPSIGKSIWLKLDSDSMQFGEVVQNFEGEADPSRLSLDFKTWEWVDTIYKNDATFVPKNPHAFTLSFNSDGTFSATTDCNAMSGSYTAENYELSFGPIAMTKKFCQGSEENEFAMQLHAVAIFSFTSKGELVLDFKDESGLMFFR